MAFLFAFCFVFIWVDSCSWCVFVVCFGVFFCFVLFLFWFGLVWFDFLLWGEGVGG